MTDKEQQNLVAQEVERVFAKRGWKTVAQAEIATGLPAGTLKRLKQGLGKAETVARFGALSGESEGRWKRIAMGLPPDETTSVTLPPDPLQQIGVELDPRSYAEALEHVQAVSAGWDNVRQPLWDAPGKLAQGLVGPIRVFKVVGDCMEPVLHDGDEIILTAPDTVLDGDIVTATVDIMTATCKRIRIPDDGAPSYLQPINGEGVIPENRFIVTGVVRRVIENVETRLKREVDRHNAEKPVC